MITKSSVTRTPFRALSLVLAVTVGLVGLAAIQAPAASAIPGGSGVKYTYRMVDVAKTASRYKSSAISSIQCNQTSKSGVSTYATGTTQSNNFSVTLDLPFSQLSQMLTGKVSVTGGVSSSTTVTETLAVTLAPKKCAQVFALRDAYSYTLQRVCNMACSAAEYGWGGNPNPWLTVGSGTYTKLIGRAYYNV